MSVNDITQTDRRLSELIAKMNALGLTPLIYIRDDEAMMAFSEREFLGALKRNLLKSGVPEEKLTVEAVPYGNDRYIKIIVKRK
ncbi:MAG: hypothetical protein JHC26_12690 [Thermofilum sp.]|jgi:hypothetical protein|uniref:hypothetical protein n=1 Tax=Thermofilum sp. TaxID=1961369 RepID=UPI0025882F0E|nr:hypothetical protein [Thermofilum sp.]MCI4409943.1 hypothetical protein [Thermofilum sp.]